MGRTCSTKGEEEEEECIQDVGGKRQKERIH
jgi:hypothetical protein